MILKDFENIVGHHCSSSAIRSLLAFDGCPLSEAMCFGLGSGLGLFYSIEEKPTEALPSRRFNGRAPNLEGNFFELFEEPLDWFKTWQPEQVTEALAQQRPLIAQTDIYGIPYYDDVHFTGHGLLVVGVEDNNIYTADIAAEGFSKMSLDDFKTSLDVDMPPMLSKYQYAVAPKLDSLNNLGQADLDDKVLQALAKTVLYMLEPPSSFEGIAGLIAFAYDLPNWKTLPDRSWTARFTYQSIEKRGTGGGNFRYLFADFLEENKSYLQCEDEVIAGFRDVALLWTKVAQSFKTIAFEESEAQVDELLSQTQQQLEFLAVSEQQLFEHLYVLIQRKVS